MQIKIALLFYNDFCSTDCCQWPMAPEFVNTADPVQQSWNGCNQSVFFNCTFSNTTLYTEEVGIAVNFGQSFSLDKENNVVSFFLLVVSETIAFDRVCQIKFKSEV